MKTGWCVRRQDLLSPLLIAHTSRVGVDNCCRWESKCRIQQVQLKHHHIPNRFPTAIDCFFIMKLISFYILFMAFCSSMVTGFVPMSAITKASIDRPTSLTKIFINIGDQERDKLTRDSEPGDYFKTWVYAKTITLDIRIVTNTCSICKYVFLFNFVSGIRIKWLMQKSFLSPLQELLSLRFHFLLEWLHSMPPNRIIFTNLLSLSKMRSQSLTNKID